MNSPYQIKHLMIMAYGRCITKDDYKKLKGETHTFSPWCREVYLCNRTLDDERERLASLKLSKPMLVFEITDAQFDARGKPKFTWSPLIVGRRASWEWERMMLPKPTKIQWWRKSLYIGGDRKEG